MNKNETSSRGKTNDDIWKALADSTRRQILDLLAEGPMTTSDIVEKFPSLCRTNVMKHMDVLVDANLVLIRREGRMRWNHINPAPIQAVCDRWISRHIRQMTQAISRLKATAERKQAKKEAEKAPSNKTQKGTAKTNRKSTNEKKPSRVKPKQKTKA